VDRATKLDIYTIPWRLTFEPGQFSADFNGDGRVDILDLGMLADKWLQNDGIVDIAPPPSGDGVVNFLDYAELTKQWLQSSGQ
jgi:hypothetical protein